MNEVEQLALRVDALRHYSEHGVKSDKDLKRFATAITGYRWLDHKVCRHHSTPWDLIRAIYFDEASEVLGVGPRSGFKTQTLGLLNAIEALLKPEIEIVHAAASVNQSLRAHLFTKQFLQTDAVRQSGLMEGAKFSKMSFRLPNGSTIEVVPGTTNGLNSVHSQRLRLDEFELVKPDVIGDARMVPATYNGYKRSLAFCSARKFRNGNVDRVLKDRKFSGVKKLIWCYAEVVEACPEERRGKGKAIIEVEDPLDPGAPPQAVDVYEKCGECALVSDCRGQLKRSDGWATIDDLIEEFMVLDRSAWNAQKRSRRVEQESGMVFRFTPRAHVVDHEIVDSLPLNVIVDFGGGAGGKTAALFWQDVEGCARVLGEYVEKGGDPDEDVPAVEAYIARVFPGAQVGKGVGDSAVPNMIKMWNARLTTYTLEPVKKLATKRDMITALKSLIQPVGSLPRYYVHSRCVVHIDQMGSFRYLDKVIQRVRQSSYSDTDNDTVDAACYLSLQIGAAEKRQPRVWVIDTQSGRVENSEPPIKFHRGEGQTSETLIRDKLWGLIMKSRRRAR